MKCSAEQLSLQKATKLMPDAVVLTDPSGRITWANEAFQTLCGYTCKEFISMRPGELLHGYDTNPTTVQQMNQAINTGSHISTEILNYHKDGSTYWASIAISPIKNESNEIEGFIAVERDVTDKHYELACLQHEIAAIYHALVKQEQKTNAHDLRPRPTA